MFPCSLPVPIQVAPQCAQAPAWLRDLDLGNVEATSYIKLRTASPLPPPTLEDIHPQAQSPGTYPPRHIPSRELTHSRPISTYDLFNPILTF
ncbi:hypothetical protein GG344DRAFT_83909 [Lentinula edodes]|nr:hypothetical protein GG344DRAFT_83909 [Lentinula edodes]